MSNNSDKGFSLAEVIAAMGIFSIAALGLIELNTESIRGASHVSWRTFAEIEANNQMAAVLSEPASNIGIVSGETVVRGRTLQWTRTLTATDTPGVLLVEVAVVRPDTGQVLTRQNALKGVVYESG